MKKIIAIILCILIVLGMCGWTSVNSKRIGPSAYITTFVDDETGVEYILFEGHTRGGVCPRYNADGTLRVREE